MTTLTDRPNTALLVIDVQNNVVAGTHDRDAVIANIATLVAKARAEQVPVVWVQHSDDNLPMGSDGWQYVAELSQQESEPLVHKHYADSFEDTDLESVLAQHRVGRLVVTGAQTDECVRSTLHGAIVRGYDATLVSRRAHHRGPQRVGRPAAGPGDRTHQPVLEQSRRTRPAGRHGAYRGGQLLTSRARSRRGPVGAPGRPSRLPSPVRCRAGAAARPGCPAVRDTAAGSAPTRQPPPRHSQP